MLAELTSLHWIGIAVVSLLSVIILAYPVISVLRMNTTQHEHKQKLNHDHKRIEWCEGQIANAREARNKMKTNQKVIDTKLDFIIDHTPLLNENQKTGIFDAIDAEPEEPQAPPLGDFAY